MIPRQINAAGLTLIQKAEGLRLAAYKDVRGVWTIGWGHTGGVYSGDTIDGAEALVLLYQDLAKFESWVTARTMPSNSGNPNPPTDNQFAAMVSLAYNIGEEGFLTSSVRRYHNEAMFAQAAADFLLWDKTHVNGQLVEVEGLLERREAEMALYLQG